MNSIHKERRIKIKYNNEVKNVYVKDNKLKKITLKDYFHDRGYLVYEFDGEQYILDTDENSIFLKENVDEYIFNVPKDTPLEQAKGKKRKSYFEMYERIKSHDPKRLTEKDISESLNNLNKLSNEKIGNKICTTKNVPLKYLRRVLTIGWKHKRNLESLEYHHLGLAIAPKIKIELNGNEDYTVKQLKSIMLESYVNDNNRNYFENSIINIGTAESRVIFEFTDKENKECSFWNFVKELRNTSHLLQLFLLTTKIRQSNSHNLKSLKSTVNETSNLFEDTDNTTHELAAKSDSSDKGDSTGKENIKTSTNNNVICDKSKNDMKSASHDLTTKARKDFFIKAVAGKSLSWSSDTFQNAVELDKSKTETDKKAITNLSTKDDHYTSKNILSEKNVSSKDHSVNNYPPHSSLISKSTKNLQSSINDSIPSPTFSDLTFNDNQQKNISPSKKSNEIIYLSHDLKKPHQKSIGHNNLSKANVEAYQDSIDNYPSCSSLLTGKSTKTNLLSSINSSIPSPTFSDLTAGNDNKQKSESPFKNPNKIVNLSHFKKPHQKSIEHNINTLKVSANVIEENLLFFSEEILGEGGQGIVRRGTYLGCPVAIKSLQKGRNDKLILKEITLLNKIRHPNIIGIMGVSPTISQVHIIMELFHSNSLFDIIFEKSVKEKFDLKQENKDKITYQMCLALNYLHLQKVPVIHRDIKPSNVLVNTLLQTKLCDLGLGQCIDVESSLQTTTAGKMCGTFWFMAPEIILHQKQATAKSDVWSFACTLIELYSESRLWEKTNCNPFLTMMMNFNEKKMPNTDALPSKLKRKIEQCFNYDDNQRPNISEILNIFMLKVH